MDLDSITDSVSSAASSASSAISSVTSTVSSVSTGLSDALTSFSALASVLGISAGNMAISQKADVRPITFVLDDESAGTFQELTLQIRPEELTVGFPSRLTVNQTMNGGWVDSFGEGIEEGTFSGTLGWRASLTDNGGVERLINLKQLVYSNWHAGRAAAIAKGDDPTKVKLFLLDSLNNYGREIAPRVFDLKRSKSRPLLAMYRFSFVMLSKDLTGSTLTSSTSAVDNSSWFSSLTGTVSNWISSFSSSLSSIVSKVTEAYQWVNSTVIAPLRSFVSSASTLFTSVYNLVSTGASLLSTVKTVATKVASAASKVFSALSSSSSVSNVGAASLASVAREYTNLYCLLANAKVSAATYETYDTLYGASTCSSTNGGTSVSSYASTDTNTWEAVLAADSTSSTVTVTSSASDALDTLSNADLVLSTLSQDDIVTALTTVNSGMTVAS